MSRATWRRRIGSGIASPARLGIRVRPSARRRTRALPGCSEPSSSHPANRCATSHIVANDVTGPRAGVGDRVLDDRRAHLGWPAGPDVGLVERQHLGRVGRVDEEERGSVLDVVAEHLRRLVPVRRAPRSVEQRDVVRVCELLRRRSGELAETDREHGAAQRVLERLPGAEVGREREGADHLGGADRRPAHRQRRRGCSGMLRRHDWILRRGEASASPPRRQASAVVRAAFFLSAAGSAGRSARTPAARRPSS